MSDTPITARQSSATSAGHAAFDFERLGHVYDGRMPSSMIVEDSPRSFSPSLTRNRDKDDHDHCDYPGYNLAASRKGKGANNPRWRHVEQDVSCAQ
jgi:hypothetical protein